MGKNTKSEFSPCFPHGFALWSSHPHERPGHWRRTQRSAAILVATVATRPAPRVFVEDIGSNTAELSWELLEESNEGGWNWAEAEL